MDELSRSTPLADHRPPSPIMPDDAHEPRTGHDPLNELLGPLGSDTFFDAHWERTPLHVSRPSDRGRFAALLSSSRIESLLGTRELRHPDVQLSRSDDPVAPSAYTDAAGRIVPPRLLEHHAAGATLVISGAHRELDSLADFRRRSERALQLRCQTNVYRSPPGRQGFHAHHDTHDVFVLQIEGRKRFDFHRGGVALPLAQDGFRPALHPPGELAESVLLEPGDTLYIPRGVTHDARADEDAPSLHITLGVFAVTVHDVLEELLRVAAEEELALRRSLDRSLWLPMPPASATATPAAATDTRDALAARLSAAFSPERLDEALARLRDELAIESLPDCRGRLSVHGAEAALDDEVRIEVRPEFIVNVERRAGREGREGREEHDDGNRDDGGHDADRLILRTFGETLEFEPPLAGALRWLLDAGEARVGDLPGLDDVRRLALCRRLLDAGIVFHRVTGSTHPGN